MSSDYPARGPKVGSRARGCPSELALGRVPKVGRLQLALLEVIAHLIAQLRDEPVHDRQPRAHAGVFDGFALAPLGEEEERRIGAHGQARQLVGRAVEPGQRNGGHVAGILRNLRHRLVEASAVAAPRGVHVQ
eukprot:CAMPEP_0180081378 /NCGR_PEP_ID=MMETSP0985-20121206/18105_1 /TAXON_ID=483367 /ORGANISM="non described non described, Strain CCMP 2436" /LENGTH=132 /DNA_ID=CAMNT_0022014587 /DNA_START=46 /DNA_END=444 /DNA_ORIENTATION=+